MVARKESMTHPRSPVFGRSAVGALVWPCPGCYPLPAACLLSEMTESPALPRAFVPLPEATS